MNNAFEFQIPWNFIFWMSILFCGLTSGLLNQFMKMSHTRNIVANCMIIFLVFTGSCFFSYCKLSTINKLIEEERIFTLQGHITKVNRSNAMDTIYLGDEFFEINYDNLYCVSGRGVFSKGEYVSLKYVDLGRWAGYIDGNCIIEFSRE